MYSAKPICYNNETLLYFVLNPLWRGAETTSLVDISKTTNKRNIKDSVVLLPDQLFIKKYIDKCDNGQNWFGNFSTFELQFHCLLLM